MILPAVLNSTQMWIQDNILQAQAKEQEEMSHELSETLIEYDEQTQTEEPLSAPPTRKKMSPQQSAVFEELQEAFLINS